MLFEFTILLTILLLFHTIADFCITKYIPFRKIQKEWVVTTVTKS